MEKKWYVSKTIWVNAIMLVSSVLVATGVAAVEISPETVAIVITVINFILRAVTKEDIVW